MAPPELESGCSESATAALEHLRGVEKQLQNEGLVFNKGTVQHLEDAVKAIKELEEEKKHIVELLEEETIKNCNLRIRLKGIPQMVMEEFEALVAAAHRSRFTKINEIEVSLQEIISAVEQMSTKQRLLEERNFALREEQKEFGSKHNETISLLNQHMAERHGMNIEINELRNMKKEEEMETAWQISATEELKKRMANERSVCKEQHGVLEGQIAELQSKLKAKKLETIKKRMDYDTLLTILQAFEEQVVERNKAIVTGKEELGKLFANVKRLLKEYEKKKAEKQEIIQKKADAQNSVAGMDVHFNDSKMALLRQIAEVEDQLESVMKSQKRLRAENSFLRAAYESMFEEEKRFREQRDDLAKQFERLSNDVTEKLDRVTKRLVEIQSMEEDQEKMEDVLETAESSYLRAIESLEFTLQSEAERSKVLQDQLNEILERFKRLQSDHEKLMKRLEEETETCQRLYAELLEQNEALEIELSQSEEKVKAFSNQFKKKDALFKKIVTSIMTLLRKLETQYNTELELLQEREEELSVNLPISEKLQMELQETTFTFDVQEDLFTGMKEEEITLAKSIARSVREVDKLRRLKGYLRGELDTQRTAAYRQLNTFSESLKFLERDNYEISRKLYIVNAENARFREAITHLRAEISTLDSETEACRSKRQEVQKEVITLYDLFDKRWSEDKQLWQLFLKRERKILKALVEHIERFKNRNALVTYVGSGLQLNYEGLASLLKGQPSTEQGNSPATSSTTK